MKQMLGHDGPPTNFWRQNLISGQPLERCPVRTIQLACCDPRSVWHEIDRHVEIYYPAYKDHHLLVRGGIGDQPARYLEMISAIRSAEARVNRKMVEVSKENAS